MLVGDGPERPAIEELVRERQLERHVLLLGLRSDVPRSLAASDIALLTSFSEALEPPSAAPSRPVNFGSGGSGSDRVLASTLGLRRRASVAVFPLVLLARSEAWPERLRPCHW